tara:strand:- start:77 stop:253 length:177 start_codon:yes stop_codon:yes gene_type:complete
LSIILDGDLFACLVECLEHVDAGLSLVWIFDPPKEARLSCGFDLSVGYEPLDLVSIDL